MNKLKYNFFQNRGIKEIHLLRKHFEIEGSGEKVKINNISIESIRKFYREYIATVSPVSLKSENILPTPDLNILRALYVGDADANMFINNVVRHSLYVDQILISDPLQSQIMLSPQDGVMTSPGKWIVTVANYALSLCSIEDWIKEGLILIIPKFSFYYPQVVQSFAQHYHQKALIVTKDYADKNRLAFCVNLIARAHPDDREAWIQSLIFHKVLTEQDDLENLYKLVDSYEKQNPIRFRLPMKDNRKYFLNNELPTQILSIDRGVPFTLANEISKETGSYLIFENKGLYDLYSKLIDEESRKPNSFEQIAIAFQGLDFPFLNNVTIDQALQIRKKGYLSSFRQYLNSLWITLSTTEDEQELEKKLFNYIDRLKAEYSTLEREWNDIYRELRIDALTKGAAAGLATVAVGNINLSFGLLTGLGISLLSGVADYQKHSSAIREAKRNPLAIFVDLK